MMWYWGGGSVHWWEWFIGFLISVTFWAFVIYFIVAIMRSFTSRGHDHVHDSEPQENPEQTLARRFANGEIDEEEFHKRLDVLRSHDLGAP